MPKKKRKERVWEYGMPKGPIPPFVYHVWFKGGTEPERFVAFDEDHIKMWEWDLEQKNKREVA